MHTINANLQPPTTMTTHKIAFIGGGNITRALIGGLLRGDWVGGDFCVGEPDAGKRRALCEEFGVEGDADNARCAARSDVVVLAVKPQQWRAAMRSMAAAMRGDARLMISVVAGIRVQALWREAGAEFAVVRAMPNTPALINAGITGLYAERADDAQRELAQTILRAVGATLWVKEESLLDAVTGVSGCGPAYFFKLMELLADSAVAHGIDRKDAELLAQQSALGAAQLAFADAQSPAQLRRQVTSKGGATEAAFAQMDSLGVDDAILRGIAAAIARAAQMGDEF